MMDKFETVLAWLLEDDADNPGARYFAQRDLAGDSAELTTAQQQIMWVCPKSQRSVEF